MSAPRATAPSFAVVIPSWTGRVAALEAALACQTLAPAQLEVVRGVHPNGRARNRGVARVQAEYLLLLDDDARPGDPRLFEKLLAPFADPRWAPLGVTGAARLVPPGANRLQRRAAREIPRVENPLVAVATESNPGVTGYVFSQITTTCCALPRRVFEEVGGFDETLPWGADTDFFRRVRGRGYRFVVAGDCFVSHAPPADWRGLLGKYYRYGIGHGTLAARAPEWRIGPRLGGALGAFGYLLLRTGGLLPNVVIPYSRAYRRWELSWKPVKALASYAAAWGYARGYLAARGGGTVRMGAPR